MIASAHLDKLYNIIAPAVASYRAGYRTRYSRAASAKERAELEQEEHMLEQMRAAFNDDAIAAVRAVQEAKEEVRYTAKDREKLRHAARAMSKYGALVARYRLPETEALRQIGRAVTAHAAALDIKRSGGGKAARLAHAKKSMAAAEAFCLVSQYSLSLKSDRKRDRLPASFTIGGPYFTLANELYGLATGRRAKLYRACDRACMAYVQQFLHDNPTFTHDGVEYVYDPGVQAYRPKSWGPTATEIDEQGDPT
jgi:hypothetical protein